MIVASEAELNAIDKGDLRYAKQLWDGVDIQPFQMKPSEYGQFNIAYDVFGDGTVLMVSYFSGTGNSRYTAQIIAEVWLRILRTLI